MATTYCFPAAVWRSAQGDFTASLLEYDGWAAVGRTAREALEQLRDVLEWQYRREPWLPPPNARDPELVTYKVPVRPMYTEHRTGRRYPVDPIQLRVHCALARQAGDMRLVALPVLGERLSIPLADPCEPEVRSAVRRRAEGMAPRELSRLIAPADMRLDNVHVSVSRDYDYFDRRPCPGWLADLRRVADPLADPRTRGLYGRAWERDQEVFELARRLRGERGNWLLLGEQGVGKTTLLCEAARAVERQAREEADEAEEPAAAPAEHRFWRTSAGRLIAGMKYLGQWEERLESVIADLRRVDGVLCVENLLDLVRVGGKYPADSVAAFCAPYLQRGELRLMGEATPEELDACRRLLPVFADLFAIFSVTPFDSARAVAALRGAARAEIAGNASSTSTLTVADDAAPRAARLFQRFEPYHALPGALASFWRDLLARPRSGEKIVTADLVTASFARRTGLPELFLRDELPLPRADVLAGLERDVIGQTPACAAAADVVTTFKAALNDPRRPLAALLFCGPTGVGKTELAKALARCLFGAGDARPENAAPADQPALADKPALAEGDAKRAAAGASRRGARLIRLDMSEYAGPWAADRLLTQGDGEPSDFVRQVRRQPFTVVLFDEIEKAHPDVFDVLMNVFDEGRLTDRFGRVTWFRSAVLVLTSNLGAATSGPLGFAEPGAGPGQQASGRHEAAARAFFRPEFFNRLDAVVTFAPLTRPVIEAITEKELRDLANREGLRERGARLRWTPEVVARLADVGFDPRYGTRPLQRAIETEVATPLARYLVALPPGAPISARLELDAAGRVEVRPE